MDGFTILVIVVGLSFAVANPTCAGRIYLDRNQNKIQDYVRNIPIDRAPEPGVAGIVVSIAGAPATALTDGNGNWAIPNVPPGATTLEVTVPPGYILTTPPNPRGINVPNIAGVFHPTPEGIGLAKIETASEPLTSGDIVAVAIGGSLVLLIFVGCCLCFWCQVGILARRHVHKQILIPASTR